MGTKMGSSPLFHSFYERVPEESITAFKIDTSAKIPDLSSIRSPELKQERLDSLMSVPSHKPIVPKFNAEQMVRTMIPLT